MARDPPERRCTSVVDVQERIFGAQNRTGVEGFAAQRRDVRHHKVRVTDQLIRLNNGEWLRKEPKTTGSVRSITISAITASVLADHLDRFANAGPDGLVFPNGAGRPVISSSFWNNHFTPALARTGVSCRFHDDLRHTSVALAIAAGAHPKAIQTRMGHSTIGRGSQPQ
jgi:integrase